MSITTFDALCVVERELSPQLMFSSQLIRKDLASCRCLVICRNAEQEASTNRLQKVPPATPAPLPVLTRINRNPTFSSHVHNNIIQLGNNQEPSLCSLHCRSPFVFWALQRDICV